MLVLKRKYNKLKDDYNRLVDTKTIMIKWFHKIKGGN